jgi:hypothetical protein
MTTSTPSPALIERYLPAAREIYAKARWSMVMTVAEKEQLIATLIATEVSAAVAAERERCADARSTARDALLELAALFDRMGAIHPSRPWSDIVNDPRSLVIRIKMVVADLAAEGKGE